MKPFKIHQFLLAFIIFFCLGCRTEDNTLPSFPEGTTQATNLWVKDQMQRYYYWADKMPKSPDYSLPTPQFFRNLLVPEDRFSIAVDTRDPATYPRSVRGLYGFDYAVVKSGSDVAAFIKLVLKDSPAANVGLKRGMAITKINGTQLTAANAVSLTESMKDYNMLTLSVADWNGAPVNEREIKVYYGYTFEQAPYSKIIDRGGKKTAYMYIPDFRDGLAQALSRQFAEFRSTGVRELVLDLRHNYGGSVASAAALCAMIPTGITADKPFIKYIGNKNGGTVDMTFASQIAFDPSAPAFSVLRANSLDLSRLYVLTSGNTASAAEIVINNLRPYMEVIQIGSRTRGKDMAGFPVKDEATPQKYSWELHPLIYKLYNAQGKGDYAGGLAPQIEADEYSILPLLPLGDESEPLLAAALGNAGRSSNTTRTRNLPRHEVLKDGSGHQIEFNLKRKR